MLKLLSIDTKTIKDDDVVQRQLRTYTEEKLKVDASPVVQNFINTDQSGENAKIQEGLTCEYIFYDNLMNDIPKSDDLDAQLEFLDKLKNLHKDVFGKEVNIHEKVNYLTTSSFEDIKQVRKGQTGDIRGGNKVWTGKSKKVPVKQKTVEVRFDTDGKDSNNEDYDYEMKSNNEGNKSSHTGKSDKVGNMKFTLGMEDMEDMHDISEIPNKRGVVKDPYATEPSKKPVPMIYENRPAKTNGTSKINDLKTKNKNLKEEIQELSMMKEDLEEKIESSFQLQKKSNTSLGLTNLKVNPKISELVSLRNQKELDIEEMKRKITRLENSNNCEDPVQQAYKSEVERGSGFKQSRFKSQIFEDGKIGGNSRIFKPKTTFLKTSEKSGSTFVNQMMNDISRVLSRGGGGGERSISQNVSMSKSYYVNQ